MQSSTPTCQRSRRAFTLIELIIVVTIIGIMLVMTVPSISSSLQANKLSQSADLLRSQLAFAQQEAMKQNSSIQVRFYLYDDPLSPGTDQKFHAYQFFRRKAFNRSSRDAGSTMTDTNTLEPITSVKKFSPPIVMSANDRLSSVASLSKASAQIPWKKRRSLDAQYVAFDYKADGSTNLSGEKQWFMTLLEMRDDRGANTPDNFATVQVDPFTGSLRLYRP